MKFSSATLELWQSGRSRSPLPSAAHDTSRAKAHSRLSKHYSWISLSIYIYDSYIILFVHGLDVRQRVRIHTRFHFWFRAQAKIGFKHATESKLVDMFFQGWESMQGSQTMLNINWKRKYFYRVNSQWIASGVFFHFGQVPQFHWFGWRSIHHYHHAICSYFWPSYHIISNHISYQAVVFFLHIASATKECLSMACLTWRITATRLCIGWAWHRFEFLANSFFKSRVSFICSDFVSLRYSWTMLQNTFFIFFQCNGRMKPTIINNQPSYLCSNLSGDC